MVIGWVGGGQGAGASGEDLGAETGQTIWAGFPPEVSFLPWFACNHSVQCTLYNVHIFPGFHISFLQRATDMRRPPISRTRLTSAPSSAKLDPSMNQIALGDLRLWTNWCVSDHQVKLFAHWLHQNVMYDQVNQVGYPKWYDTQIYIHPDICWLEIDFLKSLKLFCIQVLLRFVELHSQIYQRF